MVAPPDFTLGTDADGAPRLCLAGRWVVAEIGALDAALRAISQPLARIDMGAVSEIDTVGAWVVARLAHAHSAEIVNADAVAERLIRAVGAATAPPPDSTQAPPLARMVGQVGALVLGVGHHLALVLGFLGAVLAAWWTALIHPSRLRWRALIRQTELVGINALPIIGLMSFLVGIVIAQQGAVQLRQFGAEIYTINLTGRLSFRELGVLMTAIMVAGRSGSAFAAQIGTMKLTEEVDAMRTIGVAPVEALVLPRVLSAVLMMPLLGFYAAVLAIIGGAAISAATLDIPFITFLARIREVVPIKDVWVGLIKAPVFGLIIAMTGCYQGMLVAGNSEEVGQRTTAAVVQAIFMVIVLDAFFAIFFTEVGWG